VFVVLLNNLKKMKFVIGANNLKVFAKSILALSKIGDEIYIEPLENSVRNDINFKFSNFK
jgi:hypothetical protein